MDSGDGHRDFNRVFVTQGVELRRPASRCSWRRWRRPDAVTMSSRGIATVTDCAGGSERDAIDPLRMRSGSSAMCSPVRRKRLSWMNSAALSAERILARSSALSVSADTANSTQTRLAPRENLFFDRQIR